MSDTWEIHALKYAEWTARTRADSFLFEDDHATPHPMDFYIWVLRNGDRAILVDTGYDAAEVVRRESPVEQEPVAMLADYGLPAERIDTVVLTHLHFDHAGSLGAFSDATLHVQAAEMAFATGPCMCHDILRLPYTGAHVCDVVRSLYAGRVCFAEGSAEIAPGVETHLIGGHSRGLQCVRVRTRRGWVVLASDASHFYENMEQGVPFPVIVDAEDMLRGFDTLYRLADSPSHVIPGHDPLVRARYPALVAGDDRITCLHADPR